jgi:glycosyltransferase involved in cell wall biosynthesis
VRHLLGRYEVHWVNTIGTRPPSLDWATVSRGFGKLRDWAKRRPSAVATAANPRVLNPRMWPRFSSAFDRRLNRRLLSRQLTPLLKRLPAPPIALTTIPLVADLIDCLPVAHWVYYCVDDFTRWPGLDNSALAKMEVRLIERANVLVAVSEALQDRLAQMGRAAHLLTHGVDLAFWQARAPKDVSGPEFAGLEPPLVVFWGLIDRRMDVAFVQRLAADLRAGTIVLVGPEADPDRRLYNAPRVVRVPALPFERLPALARDAAVLIMPYADLPVTRALQPLKLKEYLATGKPVVVRKLPAVAPWADCLDAADSAEEFSRFVWLRLQHGLPKDQEQARRRLEKESWAEKARQLEEWILDPERSPNVSPN